MVSEALNTVTSLNTGCSLNSCTGTRNEGRLLETLTNKASSSGSTRSSYDMSASNSYDGVFNMKACAASISGISSISGTIAWTHDTKDRLTDESITSGSRSSGTVTGTNAYDASFNPTTLRGTASISYNNDNVRSVSTGNWAYDGNGNPTTYRGRTNTYDLPGRMSTMRYGNNWSVGYTYGADGLMASRAKTIYIYQFGQWMAVSTEPTYYIHDGGEPVFEIIGSMEGNEGEDAQTDYTVQAINVRGPDGLIARKSGSTWTYYEFDQQGNVSQRRNSTGGLVTSSIYDAYGKETNNGGTPTDPFGYNAQWGYWLDRDTGLYLCQHRWYDPVTSRWVTRDPIGYSGGANLYGYCDGSPAGGVDVTGLERILILMGEGNPSEPQYPSRFVKLGQRLSKLLGDQGNDVTFHKGGDLGYLRRVLPKYDDVIYIGHGTSAGWLGLGWNENPCDVKASDLSGALGGRRLRNLVLITCSGMKDPAWRQVAKHVFGFNDVAFHADDFLNQWDSWVDGAPAKPELLPTLTGTSEGAFLTPGVFEPSRKRKSKLVPTR